LGVKTVALGLRGLEDGMIVVDCWGDGSTEEKDPGDKSIEETRRRQSQFVVKFAR
jgi:hypothetical protein